MTASSRNDNAPKSPANGNVCSPAPSAQGLARPRRWTSIVRELRNRKGLTQSELASQLGVDPRAFVVAVMFSASASFATPIGYQTNTLVYGAGNYRFTDFLKVGVPMNIIVGVTATLAISIFFPL